MANLNAGGTKALMARLLKPLIAVVALALVFEEWLWDSLKAQLHRLTEELDFATAQHWLAQPDAPEAARYVRAWRAVDQRADRNTQLTAVMAVGHELARLTRLPGLRLMLKMMRGPARLAGMESLQGFLELGFDTFEAMGRKANGTAFFLETVRVRESRLIDLLFEADPVVGETEIESVLHV